ncbi:hypothetical protein [Paenibacillus sp. OV219]|nr:hypothetical protein [Paenibacillus sp. OV219]SEN18748.1 hypothetical protein SAMN05518847_102367 [Paenibacillus sp. OV219]
MERLEIDIIHQLFGLGVSKEEVLEFIRSDGKMPDRDITLTEQIKEQGDT